MSITMTRFENSLRSDLVMCSAPPELRDGTGFSSISPLWYLFRFAKLPVLARLVVVFQERSSFIRSLVDGLSTLRLNQLNP